MHISFGFFGLVLAIIVVLCVIFKKRKVFSLGRNTAVVQQGGDEQVKAGDAPWWTMLDARMQLKIALALADKAMPAWEKFTYSNELLYKNSVNGPLIRISPLLLQQALQALREKTVFIFPDTDKIMGNYRNAFVAPILALQDGNWSLPYHVKKLFLSVYNILKAMAEEEDSVKMKNYLALSINQSIDCMDMAKLHSHDELKAFMQNFRLIPIF